MTPGAKVCPLCRGLKRIHTARGYEGCPNCDTRKPQRAQDLVEAVHALWTCWHAYAVGHTQLANLTIAVHRAERAGMARENILIAGADAHLPLSPLQEIEKI